MSKLCSVDDYEEEAMTLLHPNAKNYYCSGALTEQTLQLNKSAFQKLRIRPRVLRLVSDRDHSVTILGKRVSCPIGIAPTAMQKMAHPEGECANARAAGSLGTIYILSTMSTSSLEEVAAAAPETTKWFQLYMFKKRDLTESLVKRAVKAGYSALVLTVDACVWGRKRVDERNKFSLPSPHKLANFSGEISSRITIKSTESALAAYVNELFELDITWEDVSWLKRISGVPVILKGIMTAEDAIIAVDHGADGILVSNHGGRQLDGCPATIEALPEIVRAVGDKVEVYLDGGVRTGTDVFRALALGAKMVFVGRPALWGLTCRGEEGVKEVLKILITEFDMSLGLAGCKCISDIEPSMIAHESRYSKL